MGGKPPSQPSQVDKQAQQAAEDVAAKNRKNRGYASTVLNTMYANAGKTTVGA